MRFFFLFVLISETDLSDGLSPHISYIFRYKFLFFNPIFALLSPGKTAPFRRVEDFLFLRKTTIFRHQQQFSSQDGLEKCAKSNKKKSTSSRDRREGNKVQNVRDTIFPTVSRLSHNPFHGSLIHFCRRHRRLLFRFDRANRSRKEGVGYLFGLKKEREREFPFFRRQRFQSDADCF